MMKIDLDDLERKARAVAGALPRTQRIGQYVRAMDEAPVTLALIARIRELEVFVDSIPDEFLHTGKLSREEIPALFTDAGGNALYMDEARSRILVRGAVLP